MKRRKLTRKQKAEIVLAQGGVCGCGCGRKLQVGNISFDHVKERRMAVDEADARAREDLSNFQALVEDPCHKAKTAEWSEKHAKAERQGGRTGQQARRQRKKAEGSYRGIPSPANPWPAKGTRKLQGRGFGA